MLSASQVTKCFLFHLPEHLRRNCQRWLSARGRQEHRAAGGLDQYPYCRPPSSWPHGRGDLMLDIEFYLGISKSACLMPGCGHLTMAHT